MPVCVDRVTVREKEREEKGKGVGKDGGRWKSTYQEADKVS